MDDREIFYGHGDLSLPPEPSTLDEPDEPFEGRRSDGLDAEFSAAFHGAPNRPSERTDTVWESDSDDNGTGSDSDGFSEDYAPTQGDASVDAMMDAFRGSALSAVPTDSSAYDDAVAPDASDLHARSNIDEPEDAYTMGEVDDLTDMDDVHDWEAEDAGRRHSLPTQGDSSVDKMMVAYGDGGHNHALPTDDSGAYEDAGAALSSRASRESEY